MADEVDNTVKQTHQLQQVDLVVVLEQTLLVDLQVVLETSQDPHLEDLEIRVETLATMQTTWQVQVVVVLELLEQTLPIQPCQVVEVEMVEDQILTV